MVCGNFILPEPASYVFFYAFFNLRNLLYIIRHYGGVLIDKSYPKDTLIHARKPETINAYRKLFNLNDEQMKKLKNLRIMAGC